MDRLEYLRSEFEKSREMNKEIRENRIKMSNRKLIPYLWEDLISNKIIGIFIPGKMKKVQWGLILDNKIGDGYIHIKTHLGVFRLKNEIGKYESVEYGNDFIYLNHLKTVDYSVVKTKHLKGKSIKTLYRELRKYDTMGSGLQKVFELKSELLKRRDEKL